MAISIELDMKEWNEGIKKLSKQFTGEAITFEMEVVANQVLKKAIDSPIPSGLRMLELSATTVRNNSKLEVAFGFSKSYAAFQDQPGKSGSIQIKPRVKKALYIPLTRAGESHRYGLNPVTAEGLKPGVDFIIRRKALIRIKPYGSALGPNHYFSETLKRNVNFMLEALTKRLQQKLGSQ